MEIAAGLSWFQIVRSQIIQVDRGHSAGLAILSDGHACATSSAPRMCRSTPPCSLFFPKARRTVAQGLARWHLRIHRQRRSPVIPQYPPDLPGSGISRDGRRGISARSAFLLPVRVPGALLLTKPSAFFGNRLSREVSLDRIEEHAQAPFIAKSAKHHISLTIWMEDGGIAVPVPARLLPSRGHIAKGGATWLVPCSRRPPHFWFAWKNGGSRPRNRISDRACRGSGEAISSAQKMPRQSAGKAR